MSCVFVIIMAMVARALSMAVHSSISTQDKVQARREAMIAMDLLKRDLMCTNRVNAPSPTLALSNWTPLAASPLSLDRNSAAGQVSVFYWYDPANKRILRALAGQPTRIVARNIEGLSVSHLPNTYLFTISIGISLKNYQTAGGPLEVLSGSAGVLQP